MQEQKKTNSQSYSKKKTLKQNMFSMMLALLCVNTTQAFTPEQDKHYRVLPEKLESHLIDTSGIVKFFAFGCSNCYAFEYQYKIPNKINTYLSEQTKENFQVQYVSVDALAGAPDLTQAWAFAEIASKNLKRPEAKEQVKQALFEGFKNNAIKNSEDVKQILLSIFKMTEDDFFTLWDSDEVINLSAEQYQLTRKLKVNTTPTLLVNSQYVVENQGFKDSGNTDTFLKRYLSTIEYLINKKD